MTWFGSGPPRKCDVVTGSMYTYTDSPHTYQVNAHKNVKSTGKTLDVVFVLKKECKCKRHLKK